MTRRTRMFQHSPPSCPALRFGGCLSPHLNLAQPDRYLFLKQNVTKSPPTWKLPAIPDKAASQVLWPPRPAWHYTHLTYLDRPLHSPMSLFHDLVDPCTSMSEMDQLQWHCWVSPWPPWGSAKLSWVVLCVYTLSRDAWRFSFLHILAHTYHQPSFPWRDVTGCYI